jgi:hypothetical protein
LSLGVVRFENPKGTCLAFMSRILASATLNYWREEERECSAAAEHSGRPSAAARTFKIFAWKMARHDFTCLPLTQLCATATTTLPSPSPAGSTTSHAPGLASVPCDRACAAPAVGRRSRPYPVRLRVCRRDGPHFLLIQLGTG